jgi:ribosomal protein L20A (L18A)
MKFKVTGNIMLGKEKRGFEKEVEGKNESHAKHIALSLFGSNNGVKRSKIEITEVKKVE